MLIFCILDSRVPPQPNKFFDGFRTIALPNQASDKQDKINEFFHSTLPETACAIEIKCRVVTDNRNLFDNALSDNQTIKRVAMMWWQTCLNVGIVDRNWQDCGTQIADCLIHPVSIRTRQLEFADSRLDCYFPNCRRADIQFVLRIGNRLMCWEAQQSILMDPPDYDMCIE